MVRGKLLGSSDQAYLTKIFKSRATNWYIVAQNEAPLHKNMPFELKIIFKGTICLLFKDAKQKLIMSKFPETILLTTPKKLMSPYQDLYFCAMDNITR